MAPAQHEDVKREIEARKWRLAGDSDAEAGGKAGRGGLQVVADPRVGDSDSGGEEGEGAGPSPAVSGAKGHDRTQEALLAGRRTFRGFNRRLEVRGRGPRAPRPAAITRRPRV